MRRYHNQVINSTTGLPVASPTITVNITGGGAATIYSDEGVTPKSNPFTGDALGRFDFYVADGDYDIIVAGSGLTPYTIVDVSIVESVQGGYLVDNDHVNVMLANAVYNRGTAQWNRLNTGRPAWRVEADSAVADDFLRVFHAAAAANPISWTEFLRMTAAGHLHPGTTALQDLGLTGTRWRDAYLSRDLYVAGTARLNEVAIGGPHPHRDLRAYLPAGFVSGVTDVTAEVQAWMSGAVDGTPLLAPQAIYIINAPITYPTAAGAVIEIRGSGSFSRLAESNTGGTIFRAGASFPATGGMFRNSSATAVRSITFKDIILDGNNEAQYCLDLANCFSTFLDNVTCLRATSHGIYQDGTTYPGPGPVGRHVIVYLNGGDGLRISGGVAGAYFTNLFAGGNTGKGAHFIGVTECWLTAPELDGNTDEGLRVNNSQKFSIDGGWVGDNGGTTLNQIAFVGASTDLSIEAVTVNKTTSSNGLTLIQLDNVTRVKIRGNTLTLPGTGINQTGILVGAGSQVTGVAIEGNTFLAATAGSNGVSASDNGGAATLTDILVRGNIMGNVTTPIYLGGISAANRARFRCTDNAGFNPQAVAAITVTASVFTYTNQDGYPEQVSVSGGTVTVISLRGTTTGLTSGIFTLYPGDTLAVTYSSAPTMNKYPM